MLIDLVQRHELVRDSGQEARIDVAVDALRVLGVRSGGPFLVVRDHLVAALAEHGAVRRSRGTNEAPEDHDEPDKDDPERQGTATDVDGLIFGHSLLSPVPVWPHPRRGAAGQPSDDPPSTGCSIAGSSIVKRAP